MRNAALFSLLILISVTAQAETTPRLFKCLASDWKTRIWEEDYFTTYEGDGVTRGRRVESIVNGRCILGPEVEVSFAGCSSVLKSVYIVPPCTL